MCSTASDCHTQSDSQSERKRDEIKSGDEACVGKGCVSVCQVRQVDDAEARAQWRVVSTWSLPEQCDVLLCASEDAMHSQ
jgi:hypothetical protein